MRKSKTDAGRRKVKIHPALRDVLLAHKPLDIRSDAFLFGTAQGKQQHPSDVRTRVIAKAVERANERLEHAGEPPLPRLTPHGLRRTFASLLYGIGEASPVVMAELGHTDPGLALSIYAHVMRRDEGENARLKALVEGADIGGLVTSDHSESSHELPIGNRSEAASRSTRGA